MTTEEHDKCIKNVKKFYAYVRKSKKSDSSQMKNSVNSVNSLINNGDKFEVESVSWIQELR
ncbi:hypothetical protein TYRP_011381 [Tyrophagus putrescentiae]|nr:hypothetical protein TYRP_011381 [Tyrophagus putrescentiae]